MSSKFDHTLDSLIFLNKPEMFQKGRICLPTTFLLQYGGSMPSKIFIQLPNAALWRGSYCKTKNCIEGLDSLFRYYDIKQFHLLVLFYGGGNKFSLEILNVYGVEILYPFCEPKTLVEGAQPVQAVWLNDCYHFSTEFEVDKLHPQLEFNCYNNSSKIFELVIGKEHLKPKVYNQIFSRKGCEELGLKEHTTCVEIGFKRLMWKIELQWINGLVFFNKCWCDFTKEGKICEGDICIFQKTLVDNRFEVAVLEKNNVGRLNRLGVCQGKSVMKFMKLLNSNNIRQCSMDFPRLFVEEYGILLLENVHFLLPDGKEFIAHYSESTGVVTGLQQMMQTYWLKEEYVLLFDYVGRSHFLVSVYNERGEDLFGFMVRKVLLQDIMKETECPSTQKKDMSKEDGRLSIDESNSLGHETGELHGGVYDLTMEIRSDHFNGIGNGLYIGKRMLDVFGKWTTATQVMFVRGSIRCLVEVDRRVDIICFEKGWMEFLYANQLEPGQKVEFVYCGNHIFQVYVHG